jgi:hypothetical protein
MSQPASAIPVPLPGPIGIAGLPSAPMDIRAGKDYSISHASPPPTPVPR